MLVEAHVITETFSQAGVPRMAPIVNPKNHHSSELRLRLRTLIQLKKGNFSKSCRKQIRKTTQDFGDAGKPQQRKKPAAD